jgi:hypothetical protein
MVCGFFNVREFPDAGDVVILVAGDEIGELAAGESPKR